VVAALLRVPEDLSLDAGDAPGRARRLMASTAVALAAIAVLNLLDIVTTNAVLSRTGAVESNPLAGALLAGGRVGLIKAAALFVLIIRLPRRRPTIGYHAVLWFVAGFYFLTVISNLLVLRRIA
jgi:Domain of unknown function (DUF5658)